MTADVSRHTPRIPVPQCPRCEGANLALQYCGCGNGLGDVYECQNYDCSYEVTIGAEGAEELLRRLVMDYGDQLRRVCDDIDCDCSVAAVLRYAEESGE